MAGMTSNCKVHFSHGLKTKGQLELQYKLAAVLRLAKQQAPDNLNKVLAAAQSWLLDSNNNC